MIARTTTVGALGFVVLVVWTFVVNGMLGFTARVEMNRVADEPAVYKVLSQNIRTPGVYLVNPALTAERQFPLDQPVFRVSHSGRGHEAAGWMALVDIATAFVTALLVAWLLLMASAGALSSWARRAGFVVAVGALLALSGDLPRAGIGGSPFGSAAAIAIVRVAGWTLAGMAMAWAVRPRAAPAQPA